MTMRSKFILLAFGSLLAACNTPDVPNAGLASVNQPQIARAVYVFDVATPGGALAPGEAARLDAWFRGLDVRYGDEIHVDGAGPMATDGIAAVATTYGLAVLPGAPVTAGALLPDTTRVIVSRTQAVVPNCPNWTQPSQPNFNNSSMSNYGCAVNSNLAAMVANPEDLIHGREAIGGSDARTATKPVTVYRNAVPTGTKGLQDLSTKKDNK